MTTARRPAENVDCGSPPCKKDLRLVTKAKSFDAITRLPKACEAVTRRATARSVTACERWRHPRWPRCDARKITKWCHRRIGPTPISTATAIVACGERSMGDRTDAAYATRHTTCAAFALAATYRNRTSALGRRPSGMTRQTTGRALPRRDGVRRQVLGGLPHRHPPAGR